MVEKLIVFLDLEVGFGTTFAYARTHFLLGFDFGSLVGN
jgi:hypothetical protein